MLTNGDELLDWWIVYPADEAVLLPQSMIPDAYLFISKATAIKREDWPVQNYR